MDLRPKIFYQLSPSRSSRRNFPVFISITSGNKPPKSKSCQGTFSCTMGSNRCHSFLYRDIGQNLSLISSRILISLLIPFRDVIQPRFRIITICKTKSMVASCKANYLSLASHIRIFPDLIKFSFGHIFIITLLIPSISG